MRFLTAAPKLMNVPPVLWQARRIVVWRRDSLVAARSVFRQAALPLALWFGYCWSCARAIHAKHVRAG